MSQPGQIHAAGGVLWRSAPGERGEPELALVHRAKYGDWSLPKGKLDAGEHPLVAAYREVVEETGHVPQVGRRLPSTNYQVAAPDGEGLRDKRVDYWAMRSVDGRFRAHEEIDDLRWVSPAAAADLLSYRHDGAVVEAFARNGGPTTTVLLVRHASAGSRRRWAGDDRLRPLDNEGLAQAEHIRTVLRVFRPARVLAADRLRCIETVRPLAETLGLAVEVRPEFTEEAHAEQPPRMAELLHSLAARGEAVVVCSQRGAIPETIAALTAGRPADPPEISARKGSVWALSFRDGQLVGADYYPRLDPDAVQTSAEQATSRPTPKG